MIICPNCGNKEMPGALFCKECGTQFTITSRDPTMHNSKQYGGSIYARMKSENGDQAVPPTPEDASLSLFLVETGEVIPLEGLT